MDERKALEKTVVAQAIEICELRERLAAAECSNDWWYRMYSEQKTKTPGDADTSTSAEDG